MLSYSSETVFCGCSLDAEHVRAVSNGILQLRSLMRPSTDRAHTIDSSAGSFCGLLLGLLGERKAERPIRARLF